jgi:hypothetical protein
VRKSSPNNFFNTIEVSSFFIFLGIEAPHKINYLYKFLCPNIGSLAKQNLFNIPKVPLDTLISPNKRSASSIIIYLGFIS